MADTVNVVIAFDKDPKRQGQKVAVSPTEARNLVRQGRARYATEAQERRAEPQKSAGQK